MPPTLDLADAVLVSEARRRLQGVHEGLGGLDREARRAVRLRLVEAWHQLEAVEAGEAALDETLARLAALEDLAPPSAPPPFRTTFVPLTRHLLRRAVSDRLIDATFDRYRHRVDVGGFVDWLVARLPPPVVQALEREAAGPGEEAPREDFELVWKRPKRRA